MTSTTVTEPQTDVQVPEVLFAQGLPGFPGPRRFALVRWGAADGPYSVMVDLDAPEVRFLVVPPQVFFPDYVVDLDDALAEALELDDADDCLVLVIVALGDRPQDATANLLGPIVVNTRTKQAAQIVLEESKYTTKKPLVSA